MLLRAHGHCALYALVASVYSALQIRAIPVNRWRGGKACVYRPEECGFSDRHCSSPAHFLSWGCNLRLFAVLLNYTSYVPDFYLFAANRKCIA